MTFQQKASPPDESTTGKHIPALDGLRGLAILLVLACHILACNPYPQGDLIVRVLARLPYNAWIGVDLFFVLSGFLITGILDDTLDDHNFFRNFYARRALRIFPLYYGFMLLLFLISRLVGDHWYSGFFAVLTYTVNLDYRGVSVTDSRFVNINHVWSLGIEEQFYLVWPLLVYFLRTRRKIAIAAGTGALLSVLVRVAWVSFTDMTLHPAAVYSWTFSHLDGLFAGAFLAVIFRSSLRKRALAAAPYLLILSSVLLAAVVWHEGGLQWEGKPLVSVGEPLLLALLFAGLLLCCLRPHALLQRIFAHPVLRFFGRLSYGLYLLHYTIYQTSTRLRDHLLATHQSKMLALLLPAVLVFLLSTAAAWLSFHYFETPFLRLKQRFTNHSRHARLADVATTDVPVSPA